MGRSTIALLILIHASPLDGVEPGAVEGTVIYTGPIPKGVDVAEAGMVRQLIERDTKTKGLRDAVVWIEGARPPAKSGAKKPVVMDQQNFFFVPHVVAIETGQEIDFTNSDSANHGIIALSAEPKNSFNVTTPPNQSYTHRFLACKNPVKIGCPVHAGMGAWVFVFDHPYFTVSDKQGNFRLPSLPPGQYTLRVRHADGPLLRSQPITIEAGRSVRLRIEFTGEDLK